MLPPLEQLQTEQENSDLQSAHRLLLNYPNDSAKAEKVIDDLAFLLDYDHIEDEPYYLFFLAYANKSISAAEKAARGFRLIGNAWNAAMARWLLGLLYCDKLETDSAKSELLGAQSSLASIGAYAELLKGDYKTRDLCKELIQQIERIIKTLPPDQKTSKILHHYPIRRPSIPLSDRQALLSFPIYDFVHAGTTGKFIFDDEPINQADFRTPIIDDAKYEIFNIRSKNTAAPINLKSSGNYIWCRVSGTSMNRATPVPIETDDFIFVDTNVKTPSINDIVVASLLDPASTTDRAGIVKRFVPKGLASESSDSYELVNFISVDGIGGIVLAVAKPISNIYSPQGPVDSLKFQRLENAGELVIEYAGIPLDLYAFGILQTNLQEIIDKVSVGLLREHESNNLSKNHIAHSIFTSKRFIKAEVQSVKIGSLEQCVIFGILATLADPNVIAIMQNLVANVIWAIGESGVRGIKKISSSLSKKHASQKQDPFDVGPNLRAIVVAIAENNKGKVSEIKLKRHFSTNNDITEEVSIVVGK